MKKVPTYQAMMPTTVLALQKLNGCASNNQISFMVMCMLDLPPNCVEKAFRDLEFSRSYLKRMGIINNAKRGTWVLNDEYRSMDADQLEKIIKEKYKALY